VRCCGRINDLLELACVEVADRVAREARETVATTQGRQLDGTLSFLHAMENGMSMLSEKLKVEAE
jgi:hypothetical protein